MNTMEEAIYKLLEQAVYCGMSINEFWNLTIPEVLIYIEQYNNRKEIELKWEAQLSYTNALLTAACFSNKKLPEIHEVFPNLFKEEAKTLQQEDWRITKDRLERFAQVHNKNRSKQ